MKTTPCRILTVLCVVLLSFSTLIILNVKAQYTSNRDPFILASQIKIESPQNKTYTTNNLTLNTFQQTLFNPNSTKLSYSIDGKENTTLPFTTKRHPIYATRTYPNGTTETVFSIQSPYNITGYANLPELTEGSHSITVYGEYALNNLIGLDNNTIHFTITNNNTNTIQDPSPSLTSTPTRGRGPIPSPEIRPTIFEIAIIAISIVVITGFIISHFKKRKTG